MGRKIDDVMKSKVIELRKSGLLYKDIALSCSISYHSVRNILDASGLEDRWIGIESQSKALSDNIIALYGQGLGHEEISTVLGVSYFPIHQAIKSIGGSFKKKDSFTSQDLEVMISEGKSMEEISNSLGISKTTLGERFKKFNLASSQKKRIALYNQNRFDTDDEFTCYFMGLFLADGYMAPSGLVELSLKDEDVISMISEQIGVPYKKSAYSREFKDAKPHYRCRISFSGRLSRGILNRMDSYKNFNTWVATLSDRNFWSFIRGHFDGDGCMYVRDLKSHIEGSASFLAATDWEKGFFTGVLSQFNSHIYARKTKNALLILNISRFEALQKLYTALYADATFYMKRKRAKFDTFFKRKAECSQARITKIS